VFDISAPGVGLPLGSVAVVTLLLTLLSLVSAGVALAYRRRGERRDALQREVAARWDPDVLTYLFEGGEPDDILSRVPPEERLLLVSHLLGYVRRVAGEDRRRIRALALPMLDEVASRLDHRQAASRARAVQTLGELGWPHYAPQVVHALDDSSPLVALIAVQILCRPEGSAYVSEVLARLDRFSSWTPRFLGTTLASAGIEGAATLRWALVDQGTGNHVKVAAAEALRLLNDFHAADSAHALLPTTKDRDVLAAVLRLLGRVGRAEHGPAVAELTNNPDFVVRVAAADGLAAIGGTPEMERLHTMVYEDPSPWVALRAARSLSQAGWRSDLQRLAASNHARAPIGAQVLAEGAGR